MATSRSRAGLFIAKNLKKLRPSTSLAYISTFRRNLKVHKSRALESTLLPPPLAATATSSGTTTAAAALNTHQSSFYSTGNSKELLSYSSTNTYWSSLIGLAGIFFGGAYIMGSQLSSSNDDGGNSKDLRQVEEAKKNDEGCLFEGKKPLVICGPSGVGKGTLLKMLFDEFEEQFSFCISHTTRKPRKGEVHGVNYYFVDKEDMVAEIEQGLFVEHASFAGNCYGTSYWALSNVEESGKVPVLEVDMQGAIQLNSRKDMKPIFCFIKPPNYEALADRLRKRGTESPEKVEKRLKQAKAELDFIDSQKSSFFQVVMVNDDLITSFKKLKSSIKSYYPHLREGSRKND
mmetsp:Transcript_28711/g.46106  ORF Transcript_28711/g.46106 Transcript_28711/m.46106 type:complete len:346 (+) Transcript_28711:51-1088(+)